MRNRVVLLLMLIFGCGTAFGVATELSADASWRGQYVGRLSGTHLERFSATLREYFGRSRGGIVGQVGPLLIDQFNGVGQPDQYRLPDGRWIVNAADGRSGTHAVAVVAGADAASILVTGFLTHLCPKAGVDENFSTPNGVKYSQHFRCELDYSLIILYRRGSRPDDALTSDLTRWAEAAVAGRAQWVILSDRKLTLKRFVRVLDDGELNLGTVDDVFPLDLHQESIDALTGFVRWAGAPQ